MEIVVSIEQIWCACHNTVFTVYKLAQPYLCDKHISSLIPHVFWPPVDPGNLEAVQRSPSLFL